MNADMSTNMVVRSQGVPTSMQVETNFEVMNAVSFLKIYGSKIKMKMRIGEGQKPFGAMKNLCIFRSVSFHVDSELCDRVA